MHCLVWSLALLPWARAREKNKASAIGDSSFVCFFGLVWSDLFGCLFCNFFGILPRAGARKKDKASAIGDSSFVGPHTQPGFGQNLTIPIPCKFVTKLMFWWRHLKEEMARENVGETAEPTPRAWII